MNDEMEARVWIVLTMLSLALCLWLSTPAQAAECPTGYYRFVHTVAEPHMLSGATDVEIREAIYAELRELKYLARENSEDRIYEYFEDREGVAEWIVDSGGPKQLGRWVTCMSRDFRRIWLPRQGSDEGVLAEWRETDIWDSVSLRVTNNRVNLAVSEVWLESAVKERTEQVRGDH